MPDREEDAPGAPAPTSVDGGGGQDDAGDEGPEAGAAPGAPSTGRRRRRRRGRGGGDRQAPPGATADSAPVAGAAPGAPAEAPRDGATRQAAPTRPEGPPREGGGQPGAPRRNDGQRGPRGDERRGNRQSAPGPTPGAEARGGRPDKGNRPGSPGPSGRADDRREARGGEPRTDEPRRERPRHEGRGPSPNERREDRRDRPRGEPRPAGDAGADRPARAPDGPRPEHGPRPERHAGGERGRRAPDRRDERGPRAVDGDEPDFRATLEPSAASSGPAREGRALGEADAWLSADGPTPAYTDRDLEGEPAPVRNEEPPLDAPDPDGEDVFLADGAEEPAPGGGTVVAVAGVKFSDAGTIHAYDAGDLTLRRGDRVVVESERGTVVASVAVASRRIQSNTGLHRIVRRASDEDLAQIAGNADREREALLVARERARERRLGIKIVRAEYALGAPRLLVHYASEERVDVRELARDLSTKLRARVDLRQVGARDEAKMVGGIGSCGRELCCSTFLPSFAPISIKMAKDQNLVLNPTKVAGQCGRLKCCLVYEQDLYVQMRKTLPKVGKRVRTPGGDGKVVELDVLRQRVRVVFEEGGHETFPGDVIEVLAPPAPPPRS